MSKSDLESLRRIVGDIVPVEHCEDGMLTLRFEDGTRLAFCCNDVGRLNMVVIQHGKDTPELRLLAREQD